MLQRGVSPSLARPPRRSEQGAVYHPARSEGSGAAAGDFASLNSYQLGFIDPKRVLLLARDHSLAVLSFRRRVDVSCRFIVHEQVSLIPASESASRPVIV